MKFNDILTKERIEYVRSARKYARESAFSEARAKIGDAAADALERLYDSFDERIYIFLAELWDPEIGAFYYSKSARDTNLYLPDIESTVQVLRFLGNTGMIRPGEGKHMMRMPAEFREKIVNFAKGLQDEDGYFYHPQWGKEISPSRRGRDLAWAKSIFAETGEHPIRLLPTQKNAAGEKSKSLPEYLQDIECFKKYLSEMDLKTNSYYVGNLIESTISQISAAGEEFEKYLLGWLNSQNREDNGLWEEGISYASVNGLMKIAGNYPHLKASLPNAAKSLQSAIYAALSDERMKFVCEVYNPWAAMCSIFKANKDQSDEKELRALRDELIKNAPALIKKNGEKVSVFKKEDGSYSYFKKMSSAVSQRAPVAVPRTNEGDVNATTICVNSNLRSLREALEIPMIPVFCPEDGDLFFELIANAPKVEKKVFIGDTFPDKPSYEEEITE